MHYKPGKNDILADALSQRPYHDPRHVLGRQCSDDDDDGKCATCGALNLTRVVSELPLHDEIVPAYAGDPDYADIITHLRSPNDVSLEAHSRTKRVHISRYSLNGDLLMYNIDRLDTPRTVIANVSDLRARITHKFHHTPAGGHLGREKIYAAVSYDF